MFSFDINSSQPYSQVLSHEELTLHVYIEPRYITGHRDIDILHCIVISSPAYNKSCTFAVISMKKSTIRSWIIFIELK